MKDVEEATDPRSLTAETSSCPLVISKCLRTTSTISTGYNRIKLWTGHKRQLDRTWLNFNGSFKSLMAITKELELMVRRWNAAFLVTMVASEGMATSVQTLALGGDALLGEKEDKVLPVVTAL
jgi:hypothetical protein